MKNVLTYMLSSIIILMFSMPVQAKDQYSVTILPFTVHSAENIDYVKQGIEEMLTSRIGASDKITVTNRSIVTAELKKIKSSDLSLEEIYVLGKKLNSDYVIWGSIAKIGGSVHINGKLTDILNTKSDFVVNTYSQTLDDVIPKINDFSERILSHILGTTAPAETRSATSLSSATSPEVPSALSRESQIIANMRKGPKKVGTLTSVINAEFINAAEPLNRKNFWMSQKIPTEFRGMDIGNVNNDGLNDIVIIDKNNVYIYQKTDKELKLLEKINGKAHHNYIAVDIADINRNGTNEIFVTALNGTLLESFVLEFKNGKFEIIASNIRWFFRVIDNSSGMPLLLGQQYGFIKPFDTPIYEMIWKDGKYQSDQKLRIPVGLSIYGLNIDDIGIDGKEKVIALNELDYLYITEKTEKSLGRLTSIGFTSEELIWKSDDVYGGSNTYIESSDKAYSSDRENNAFINLRILTLDTNNDGKKEIILVKNLSSVGRIFKNIKLFTSSEIYNLEWDGMGLAENWRTKKINGYVADYALKDIDNDGKQEIVLALVQSTGASLRDRSVLVVYKLDVE